MFAFPSSFFAVQWGWQHLWADCVSSPAVRKLNLIKRSMCMGMFIWVWVLSPWEWLWVYGVYLFRTRNPISFFQFYTTCLKNHIKTKWMNKSLLNTPVAQIRARMTVDQKVHFPTQNTEYVLGIKESTDFFIIICQVSALWTALVKFRLKPGAQS